MKLPGTVLSANIESVGRQYATLARPMTGKAALTGMATVSGLALVGRQAPAQGL